MKMRNFAAACLFAATALTAVPSFAQDASRSLTIALSTDINTLDPHMTASIGSDMSVLSHIYTALILRDANLKLQPSLATSWQVVDDNTWRFKLAPDAAFANGEKLDAAAVKWNFDRVRDPKVNARIKGWFTPVKDVTVIDPTTIEIKTSEPYPALADQMSMFFLLPPKWGSETNPATATMPGGAYQIKERVPGSRIVLEPNPKYWGPKPKFGPVTYQIIPEDAARSAALLAGEIDFATKIPVTEIDRLQATGKVTAGAIASTRTAFLKINLRKPPMNSKALRQALNYAVDKEGIAKALFNGKAELPKCQLMSKDYFGYNPDLKDYSYDPEKAMQLLKDAKFDTSQTIELDLPVAVYVQAEEVAQALVAQYEAIGLKVKISEMNFGTFMDKQVKAKNMAQMGYLTYSWPTMDADGIVSLFEPGNAYDYWDNQDFGKLVLAGRSSTDPAKRTEVYKQATKMMCDEAPVVFLYNQPVTYASSKKVAWHARGDDWVLASDFDPK